MWTKGQWRTTLPPGGKGSSGGGLPRRPAVHPAGRLFFAHVKAIGNSVGQGFRVLRSPDHRYDQAPCQGVTDCLIRHCRWQTEILPATHSHRSGVILISWSPEAPQPWKEPSLHTFGILKMTTQSAELQSSELQALDR